MQMTFANALEEVSPDPEEIAQCQALAAKARLSGSSNIMLDLDRISEIPDEASRTVALTNIIETILTLNKKRS